MNDTRKIKYLYFYSIVWLVLLTAIPTILYKSLPLDSMEVTAWANPLEMGNAKHPPLGSWLAWLFEGMFFHKDFSLYFLSQVLIVSGFYYLYKLGREYFDVTKSVISVVVISFVMYYSFGSSTYNVNLPQMLLWPMCVYYFVHAYHKEKMLDWILFGVATGLITLSKYFGLILPFSLFFFVLSSKETRKLFVQPGPYVAVGACLLVLLPHIIWLSQYDFVPFTYIAERASESEPVYWYSFLLVFVICLALVPPALAALWLSLDHPFKALCSLKLKLPRPVNDEAFRLGLSLFLVPTLVFTLMTLCGATIDLKWTFPIYITDGLFLMSLWKNEISDREFKKIFWISFSVFVAFQVLDVVLFMTKTNRRLHTDMSLIARQAHEYYVNTTGEDRIPAVYGDIWVATSVGHYLPYHPHTGSLEDAYDVIRFGEEIRKHGALAAMNSMEDVDVIAKDFPIDAEKTMEIHLVYKAKWGNTKERSYFFTIIPPSEQ